MLSPANSHEQNLCLEATTLPQEPRSSTRFSARRVVHYEFFWIVKDITVEEKGFVYKNQSHKRCGSDYALIFVIYCVFNFII